MSNKVVMVFCYIFLLFRQSRSYLSSEFINAINDHWKEYSRLSSYSIQVSVYISQMAYRMNKDLFSASDDVINDATTFKFELMSISHKKQVEDVLKSRCINRLGIPEALKRTDEDIEHAAACFLAEANKRSVLETSLTGAVNEFRSRVIKGVRALEQCSTKKNTANTCIEQIIKDRQESAQILRKELNTLKERILILEDKLSRTIASCRRIGSKSLSVLRKLTETIKAC